MAKKFPQYVDQRIVVALDITKHIPTDIILRALSTGEAISEKTGKTSSSGLSKIVKGLGGKGTEKSIPTLYNFGLVGKETDIATGYEVGTYIHLTKIGEVIGRRIADLPVAYSADNGIALVDIFGYTPYNLKRTGRRYQTIDYLALARGMGEEVRKIHLMYETGANIDNDLVQLTEQGIVDVDVEDVEEVIVRASKFTGSEDEFQKLAGIEREIAESLRKGNYGLKDLVKDLGYKPATLIHYLRVLGELGLTYPISSFVNRKKITVNLTERGVHLWQNFLQPLREIVSPESELGFQLSDKEFKEKVRTAMQLYNAAMQKS